MVLSFKKEGRYTFKYNDPRSVDGRNHPYFSSTSEAV